ADERPGDSEHLLLTSGQRTATLMLAPLKQRKEIEHMLQILGEIGRIRGDEGTHLQVFQNGHACENPASLRRLRDPEPSDLMGWKGGNILASEQDSSFGVARAPGRPKIDIMRVLLPAPLAPISATISPRRMSRLTPCSTGILP